MRRKKDLIIDPSDICYEEEYYRYFRYENTILINEIKTSTILSDTLSPAIIGLRP